MLRFVLMDTSLFDQTNNSKELEDTRTDLMWLQEGLAIIDQGYLKRHPETPPLYKSGVVYKLPAQFDGEPEEVTTLKKALGSKANQADVAAVLDTISNVFGGERFRDIGRILENGGGDCLPIETLVETLDGRVAIGDVRVGDAIRDLANNGHPYFAFVNKVWARSTKPTITFFLDNGTKLVSSPDHRHAYWKTTKQVEYIRAEKIKTGDRLVCASEFGRAIMVKAIEHSAPRECVDITTSSGTFVLPECDIVTHNCDNLAAWRVAELRQAGIAAKPYMTNRARSDGGTTYHALVQWPPFANVPYPTSEDPSLLLGMSQPQRAADRDEEIRKNQERCALIKKYGIKPVTGAGVAQQSPSHVSDFEMANFDDALQGILGIGRRAPVAAALEDDVSRDQSEIANLWRRR